MTLGVFIFLAALAVLSALGTVAQRNPVHCLLALVVTLLTIAVIFIGLDAVTVGFLQAIVYAGAIMVLFLFVIMLLNPTALEQRRRAWWGLGVVAALLLAAVLIPQMIEGEQTADPIASTQLFGSPETLAKSLFTDFVLPFEIASVLLLVAIVGAVVLGKRER